MFGTRAAIRANLPVILLLLIAGLGYGGALEWAASHGPLGAVQHDVVAYLDKSEAKAVEAFAVARTINAAVSLLKSADLSAVVAQIAPLQVLEPVDDLAKQFSDVMVVSIVALQLQRLLLLMSRAWALSLGLPIGCVLLSLSAFLAQRTALSLRLATLGRGVIIVAIFARSVVPVAGLIGNGMTNEFLGGDLDRTMKVLSASGTHLSQITAGETAPGAASAPSQGVVSPPPSAQTVIGQFENRVEQAFGTASKNSEALMNSAGAWIPDKAAISTFVADVPEQIVRAIEIFLVQTLLTPLIVGLAVYGVLRGAMRPLRQEQKAVLF